MKVMLIYPDVDPLSIIPGRLINIEPLQMEYLAAMIPEQDVIIIDMKTDRRWKTVIEKFAPDIVGITGTVIHATRIIEILRIIKEMNQQILTIVGGPHATLVPDDFDDPSVDIIALGHSHQSFQQVVRAFESNSPFGDISDLAFRTDRGLRYTKRNTQRTNLNDLPMPRRDLTARYRSKYCHLVWEKVALMVSSIGCPHGCSFCPCPVLTGRRVLRRSPHLVLRELSEINEKYVYFGDDNFFFDPRHASEIARLIEQFKIKKEYYMLSRADSIVNRPDIVEKWASIGLKKVFIGLETVSDIEMKQLHKKGSVDINTRAVEILHANKVDPLGAFIVRPDFKERDFEDILRYMDRMKIFYFEFTVLTPFPGTPFYEEVRDQLTYTDTRLYDLAHPVLPTTLSLDEFYTFYSRLHRKAMSAGRAVRIRPVVSPLRAKPLVRILPGIVDLFRCARRSHRLFRQMSSRAS
ncbi:MAG: radical SAM protein [Candidatus Zixiibacteriota bacterium]